MELLILVIGIGAGVAIGFLIGGRKNAALRSQLEAARERETLLNQTTEERIAREKEAANEWLKNTDEFEKVFDTTHWYMDNQLLVFELDLQDIYYGPKDP